MPTDVLIAEDLEGFGEGWVVADEEVERGLEVGA